VFVSVYENNSDDRTKMYLNLLRVLLNKMSVQNRIVASDEKKPIGVHRISYLAGVRNTVLEPLLGLPRNISKVVFMNDITFCASDLLELLIQSRVHAADITCGADFFKGYDPQFYDKWVFRGFEGNMISPRLSTKLANSFLNKGPDPFQVQCCWNGAAVFNARPFYEPFRITFRKRDTQVLHDSDERHRALAKRFPGTPLYTECASAAENTICQDIQRAGFTRAIVVPTARFAYDWITFKAIRKAKGHEFVIKANHSINFQPLSDVVDCLPMNAAGIQRPDGKLGKEVLH